MTRSRSTYAPLLAGLTASTLVSSGCVGLGSGSVDSVNTPSAGFGLIDLDSPEMRQFPVASMTDMERDVRLETSDREGEKLTPALFWTGIGVGTVAAVGGVAFGVAGYVTKRQIIDGYESGITLDDRDALTSRGKAFNGVSIAMATVAVFAYTLAIVTYGVDWNRCGPLVAKNKKRRCADVLK
jgi:hypothetical protein